MKSIKGKISTFSEMGMEGTAWVILEDGKFSYDALNPLSYHGKNLLKIYQINEDKSETLLFDDNLILASHYFLGQHLDDSKKSKDKIKELKKYVNKGKWQAFTFLGMSDLYHLPANIDLDLWKNLYLGEINYRLEAKITNGKASV